MIYGAETIITSISIGTHDLVQFLPFLEIWKYIIDGIWYDAMAHMITKSEMTQITNMTQITKIKLLK